MNAISMPRCGTFPAPRPATSPERQRRLQPKPWEDCAPVAPLGGWARNAGPLSPGTLTPPQPVVLAPQPAPNPALQTVDRAADAAVTGAAVAVGTVIGGPIGAAVGAGVGILIVGLGGWLRGR